MVKHNENKALRLVQWLSDQAIDGVRPLWSARDLAKMGAIGGRRLLRKTETLKS